MNEQTQQTSSDKFKKAVLSLYSNDQETRIAAIPQILNFGKIGEDLVTNLIATEDEKFAEVVFDIFSENLNQKLKELNLEKQAVEARLSAEFKKLEKEYLKIEEQRRKLQQHKRDEEFKQANRNQQINVIYEKLHSLRQIDTVKQIESKRIEEAKRLEKARLEEAKRLEKERLEEAASKFIECFGVVELEEFKHLLAQYYQEYKSKKGSIDEVETFLNLSDFVSLQDIFVLSNWDKLRKLTVDQLEVDINNCTLNADLTYDLGADDLDVVELIMAIEEEFDIEIPDEEAGELGIIKYVSIDHIEHHIELGKVFLHILSKLSY